MGKNGRFTNTDVKGLKGKNDGGKNLHALGDLLYVRVREDGRKTYVFIYRPKLGPRRGKKIMLTLGPTDQLDIEAARQWAREQITLIAAHGKDPYQERQDTKQANHLKALRTKTLGQIAQEYVDQKSSPDDDKPWGRHYKKTMGGVLKRLQAMPIAKLPVDKIARADFEKVINDIGKDAPAMALHFRDLMFGAMKEAGNQGCYQGENLADPRKLKIRIKHTSKRQPGWDFDELPRLWRLLCEAEIDCSHDGMWTTAQIAKGSGFDRQAVLSRIKRKNADGTPMLPAKQINVGKNAGYLMYPADAEKAGLRIVNANAESSFGEAHLAIPVLKLLLLTGVRFSEVNEMRSDEIDWRRKLWIIPEDRTKSKRKHVVPLIDPALEILKKMERRREILEKMERRRDDGVPYVFAHGPALTGAGYHFGEPLTNGCVRRHLKRISGDDGITIHSFRRGLGSWTDSQFIQVNGSLQGKYDTKFRRAVLGHAVSNGLDYIYGADARFEKPCRILLSDWADHLIHGPSRPSESESAEVEPSESAEVVELSTRRNAGA
jgi:hypothetical protein